MGLSRSLDKLAGRCFHEKDVTKKVTIIGGGNVGEMLADNLEDANIRVKVIERDAQRCQKLSENLSDTLIINGDGTDLALLNEEDISASDVVVSVTNNDEKNLLCSLLAKQLGVKRVISRVTKNANIPLFEHVGIDIALSDKIAALNEVKNSVSGGKVDILATVEQGKG
jgi:trk system potassium uptake protein TrkA